MRAVLIILGTLALAGCATYGPARSGESIVQGAAPQLVAAPGAAMTPAPASGLSQFVIPVSGGAMFVALPLGGSFFLPVDGSAPMASIAVPH